LTLPRRGQILRARGCSRLPREASAQNRVLTLEIRGGRSMPSNTEITVPQLSRLIGLPDTPVLIDVRSADDYRADPRLLPASCRRDYHALSDWAPSFYGRPVIVICEGGLKLSQGVAAFLRNEGIDAQTLEGGFEAWRDAGQLLLKTDKLPTLDEKGRTVW